MAPPNFRAAHHWGSCLVYDSHLSRVIPEMALLSKWESVLKAIASSPESPEVTRSRLMSLLVLNWTPPLAGFMDFTSVR